MKIRKPTFRKIVRAAGVLILTAILLFFGNALIGPMIWGIDDASTRQIRKGMSQEEVERILGKPHNVESGNPWDQEVLWEYYLRDFGLTATLAPFCVSFDKEGQVTEFWVQ